MLLQLEDYRKQCIYKLINSLNQVLSPQQLVLITEKLRAIKSADSITRINEVMELDIGLKNQEELDINRDKSSEWSKTLIQDDDLQQMSLSTTLFHGLNWLCAMRVYHCVLNGLSYTNTYDKVLKACYKKNGYCPCKIPQADTFCPCVEHLDEIEKDGHCHCNMFKS